VAGDATAAGVAQGEPGGDVRTGFGSRLSCSLAAVACAVATAACSSAASSSPAAPSPSAVPSTATAEPSGPGTYLALGDSVPFGFRVAAPAEYRNAADFIGYPELIGQDRGLRVVNATCPGETTASFLDTTAQSNGCENRPGSATGFRTDFPLHVDYDSPDQSQLDYAVDTLQETPDVELVTLQIGANDGFLCQMRTADQCASEVGTVASTVQANVDTILAALRSEGGYDGPIVVLTYYALDYSDPMAASTQVLNGGIEQAARANGALVASGFEAFRPGAEAAGGDAVEADLVRPDDVHPTEEGQRLLAEAVEAVVPD
jgi:lysophospholipase L1-like esterase